MSDYTKITNFTVKDSLPSGNVGKTILGAEHDTEFDNIQVAVATKSDKAVPATTNNLAMLDVTGNLADSLVETDGAGNITADVTGNLTGAVTGNATTATAIAASQNFSMSGDVTASSVSFNGTSGVNLVTSLSSGSVGTSELVNLSVTSDKVATDAVSFTNNISKIGTVGTSSVTGSNTAPLAAGVWYFFTSSEDLTVQAQINGTWRNVDVIIAGGAGGPVISDGVNARLRGVAAGTTYHYTRMYS